MEAEGEPSVVYLAGNSLAFVGLRSAKRRYLFSIDDCGVGAFVVHPTHKYIAVGETGSNPKIYVYNYPDLQLSKQLCNGAFLLLNKYYAQNVILTNSTFVNLFGFLFTSRVP